MNYIPFLLDPRRPSRIKSNPWNSDVTPVMQNFPEVDQRNPYHRADSIPELLSWNDVDFVRCAYVTVLGRQPDRHGEAYYTDRIRRGHSKLNILRQLRHSTEGRRHDPGIAGFDRALRRAAWQRRFGIGWFFRLLWPAEERIEPRDPHFRATMNALAANSAAIRDLGEKLRQSNFAAADGGQEIVHVWPPEAPVQRRNPLQPTVPEVEHLRPKSPLAHYFVRNVA